MGLFQKIFWKFKEMENTEQIQAIMHKKLFRQLFPLPTPRSSEDRQDQQSQQDQRFWYTGNNHLYQEKVRIGLEKLVLLTLSFVYFS